MALRAGDKGVNSKDLTPLSNRVKDLNDLDAYLTKDEASRTYLTLLQSEEFLTKLVAQATYQTIANMVNYQEKLVDGQSIKRLNGESLLGSGNISVLTQTIANTLYQTISGMSAYVKWEDLPDVPSLDDYVKKTDAVGYNDILTKTLAQSLYQTISGMIEYLKKTDAQSLYQTISGMSAYLKKTDADGYNDILTKTVAQSLYQTISGMSAYLKKTDAVGYNDILTKTLAQSLYQTISGMADYVKKTDAVGYNDILTKTLAQSLYQVKLQSGVNIKTINNQNLLGSGNIDIQGGGFTTDLLWTNSSPETSFAAQTVSLDLSGYRCFVVYTRHYVNDNSTSSVFLVKSDNEVMLVVHGQTGNWACRYITSITDNGIIFGNGRSSNGGINDQAGIPYQIYGIK